MQGERVAWLGSQGGTGIPDWSRISREEGGYAGKILDWAKQYLMGYPTLA